MMKICFLSLALMAMLGLVLSASVEDPEEIEGETMANLSLLPEINENIAQLDGAQAMFIDYCKEMLTFVTVKVTDDTDNVKSQVFNVIFTTGKDIANDSLDTGSKAVEQLSERLNNPNLPLDDSDGKAEDVEKIVNQSARNIKERTTNNGLLESGKAVLSVMAVKAFQVIQRNVAQARTMITPQTISMLSEGCERFQEEYMHHVRERFIEVREMAQDAAAAEPGHVKLAVEIGKIRLNELKCGVTKNMIMASNVCQIYQAASPVMLNIATGI